MRELNMDRSGVVSDHDFDGFEMKLADDTGEVKTYQMTGEQLAALRWALTAVEQRVHSSDENDYSYGLTEDE